MCIHSLLLLAARDVLEALFPTLNAATVLINPNIDFSTEYVSMLLYANKKTHSKYFRKLLKLDTWLYLVQKMVWVDAKKKRINKKQNRTKLAVSPIKTNFDIRLLYTLFYLIHIPYGIYVCRAPFMICDFRTSFDSVADKTLLLFQWIFVRCRVPIKYTKCRKSSSSRVFVCNFFLGRIDFILKFMHVGFTLFFNSQFVVHNIDDIPCWSIIKEKQNSTVRQRWCTHERVFE